MLPDQQHGQDRLHWSCRDRVVPCVRRPLLGWKTVNFGQYTDGVMGNLPPSGQHDDRIITFRGIINNSLSHGGRAIIATARFRQVAFQVSRIFGRVNTLYCDIWEICFQCLKKLGSYPDSDISFKILLDILSLSYVRNESHPESNVPLAKRTATGAQAPLPLMMLTISFAVSDRPARDSISTPKARDVPRAIRAN
jgi:hypothetical protein